MEICGKRTQLMGVFLVWEIHTMFFIVLQKYDPVSLSVEGSRD